MASTREKTVENSKLTSENKDDYARPVRAYILHFHFMSFSLLP